MILVTMRGTIGATCSTKKKEEKFVLQGVLRKQVKASHTRQRKISEQGAGNEQTWERVSGRKTVVGWMFTAKRREASGWILHVLTEESGGVSSFSGVRQQVLARPLGQPTEGHEEA